MGMCIGNSNNTHLLNRRFGLVTPTPTPPALLTLLASSNLSLSFIISPLSGVVSSTIALEDLLVMDELDALWSSFRMDVCRLGRFDEPEEEEDGAGVILGYDHQPSLGGFDYGEWFGAHV
jgi:hypothetical protein